MPTQPLTLNPLAPTSQITSTGASLQPSFEASTLLYDACYYLSYGLVYPIAWIGHLIPKENPLSFGIRDGAKAAWDELHIRN